MKKLILVLTMLLVGMSFVSCDKVETKRLSNDWNLIEYSIRQITEYNNGDIKVEYYDAIRQLYVESNQPIINKYDNKLIYNISDEEIKYTTDKGFGIYYIDYIENDKYYYTHMLFNKDGEIKTYDYIYLSFFEVINISSKTLELRNYKITRQSEMPEEDIQLQSLDYNYICEK